MSSSRRAVIYTRISRDGAGEGLGVLRQREACEKLVAERGWTLVEVFEDNDISAFSGRRRPGYEAALDLLGSGEAEYLVAWHVDRLYRRLTDLERLVDLCQKRRVSIVTVTAGDMDLNTSSGLLVASLLGAVARSEVERTRERVLAARKQKIDRGEHPGSPIPYGFQLVDKRLVPNPETAGFVQILAERVARGDTLASAGRWMASQGQKTVKGNLFTVTAVTQVLMRPRTGLLVDAATLAQARAQILSRKGSNPKARKFLMTGVALCSCGSTVRGAVDTHGKLIYRCGQRDGQREGHASVNAAQADDYALWHVAYRLVDPALITALMP
ncbi:MAG: recombinase family protein, partial [Pseudonocardiales bacterium]|nr:recombinase family protein [Pseudonocardiales bacterium]